MKPLFTLLVCLLMSACSGKAGLPTAPSPVATPAAKPVAATCTPFDLVWDKDVNAASPIVTLTVNRSVDRFEVLLNGEVVTLTTTTPTRVVFNGLFTRSYTARAMVAGCWSNVYAFEVGPANPTGGGGNTPVPAPVPPPTPTPNPDVCTYEQWLRGECEGERN